MKKIFLTIITILLISVPCFADDQVISEPEEKPLFEMAGLNIQGDTLIYFDGDTELGVGIKLGSFKQDLIELRAEFAENKTGVGLSVNIPTLVEKAGGTWDALNFNPSLGIVGMVELNDVKDSKIAINANIINLKF